jgi:phytoene/squalene synthetase
VDQVVEQGRAIIEKGSKSFAAAARLFDPSTRASAYLLYAWCRHCDDQTDDQELGFGASRLQASEGRLRLDRLRAQTLRTLSGEPVDDPIFAGLQRVVADSEIPHRYPLEHLDGFLMDIEGRQYRSFGDTMEYCYHVAGVVGVMMAYVMGVRDEPTLDRATDLGLAFQLTNICRDVMEDAKVGRVYLPRDWLDEAGVPATEIRLIVARDLAAAVPVGVGGSSRQRGLPRHRKADTRGGSASLGSQGVHGQEAEDPTRARRRTTGAGRAGLGRGPERPAAHRAMDATGQPRVTMGIRREVAELLLRVGRSI